MRTFCRYRHRTSCECAFFTDHRSGDILEVRMLVPENQRKQYIYRGVCIARYNKGIRSSFKMYNVYPDGGPVVQVRLKITWDTGFGLKAFIFLPYCPISVEFQPLNPLMFPCMQHIPLYMPDLLSIEVVGKVQAGSREKKYHILENSSSKYSFQKQVWYRIRLCRTLMKQAVRMLNETSRAHADKVIVFTFIHIYYRITILCFQMSAKPSSLTFQVKAVAAEIPEGAKAVKPGSSKK